MIVEKAAVSIFFCGGGGEGFSWIQKKNPIYFDLTWYNFKMLYDKLS